MGSVGGKECLAGESRGRNCPRSARALSARTPGSTGLSQRKLVQHQSNDKRGSLSDPEYAFPTTTAQQSLWYLDRLQAGSPGRRRSRYHSDCCAVVVGKAYSGSERLPRLSLGWCCTSFLWLKPVEPGVRADSARAERGQFLPRLSPAKHSLPPTDPIQKPP